MTPKSTGAQVSCEKEHSSCALRTPPVGGNAEGRRAVLVTTALHALVCGEADSPCSPFLPLTTPSTSTVFQDLPACLLFHIDFQVGLSNSKKNMNLKTKNYYEINQQ